MFEAYYDIIRESGLFARIDIQLVERLLQEVDPPIVQYKKNEVIRTEGDPLIECGFVLMGEVIYTRHSLKGERSLVELVPQGSLFGEILLYSQEENRWPATAVARTDCEIMFIHSDWMLGIKRVPYIAFEDFLLNLIRPLCERAVNLFNLLKCFTSITIREKLCKYLYQRYLIDKNTVITLTYDRDELADFLFIPRTSLSRELSNMKRDGLIDFRKSVITIKDLDQLQAYI